MWTTADRAAGYGNGTDTRIDIGSSLVNWTRGALATHTPSTRGGTAADDIANHEAFLAPTQPPQLIVECRVKVDRRYPARQKNTI